MTLSPIQILENLREIGDVRDLTEDPIALRFTGVFASAEQQSIWRSLIDSADGCLDEIAISLDRSDLQLADVAGEFSPTRRFHFSLLKRAAPGERRFFFESGIGAALADDGGPPLLRVASLQASQAFKAIGLSVEPWDSNDKAIKPELPGPLIDPSREVLDVAEPRVAPRDLRRWMLSQEPVHESEAYSLWKNLAALKTWVSLIDQVSGSPPAYRYRLSGPPVVDLKVETNEIEQGFRPLQAATKWVFWGNADHESRRLLFSIELAHAMRLAGAVVPDAVPTALVNSKSAYRAHVQSANRDTLAALSKIRLAAIEETQNVVSRTHDLASSLSRDIVIGSIPLIIRVFPNALTLGEAASKAFSIIISLYLFGSILSQAFINGSFFEQQKESRNAWRDTVSRFLASSELSELSDGPIEKAKSTYTKVLFSVCILYAILLVIVITIGFSPRVDGAQ